MLIALVKIIRVILFFGIAIQAWGYQDANQFGATMNNIEKYQAQLITKN